MKGCWQQYPEYGHIVYTPWSPPHPEFWEHGDLPPKVAELFQDKATKWSYDGRFLHCVWVNSRTGEVLDATYKRYFHPDPVDDERSKKAFVGRKVL